MIPTIFVLVFALMSFLGWLSEAAQTRRFWLGVQRYGRFLGNMPARCLPRGKDAADKAYDYFHQRHFDSYLNFEPFAKSFAWHDRAMDRLNRYYSGIPVFKNKGFTLP